jgi:hypothetical protein
MTETTEKDSTTYIDWLERAISENYIKYYDYAEFTNKEEISNGSFGKVFCVNRKDSDTVMALKHPFNLAIKEIVNEVNYCYKHYSDVFSTFLTSTLILYCTTVFIILD